MSTPDARERFSVVVDAPPELVYEVVTQFDMESVRLVRWILRMREKLLGSRAERRPRTGLLTGMRALGWGCLVERPGELVVCGAVCEPWLADVVFSPVPATEFAEYGAPGRVKIAWTLETHPSDGGRTRLATETRAVATDARARKRFRRYWRWARFGIVLLRRVLLPAMRREAEREWRERRAGARSS